MVDNLSSSHALVMELAATAPQAFLPLEGSAIGVESTQTSKLGYSVIAPKAVSLRGSAMVEADLLA